MIKKDEIERGQWCREMKVGRRKWDENESMEMKSNDEIKIAVMKLKTRKRNWKHVFITLFQGKPWNWKSNAFFLLGHEPQLLPPPKTRNWNQHSLVMKSAGENEIKSKQMMKWVSKILSGERHRERRRGTAKEKGNRERESERKEV